ncbi:HAD-like domain-containing protein [Dipodascopsis tothii]|uniref:HAD-like domain-containing protein n=1 Tax=Dipodascopsis tothii TaxID=44089 RepID=UPI0034CEEF20
MSRILRIGAQAGQVEIKGVVFDMDGTLCLPQTWMFGKMRETLGIDKSVDILDHIYSLEPVEQEAAHERVRAVERDAMVQMTAQPGVHELMDFLETTGVAKAICTRNFEAPVDHLLTNLLTGRVFEPVVTRTFRPPKPSPAGIQHIAAQWGVKPNELVMVGDSVDDMLAGRRAGAATVLLSSDVNGHLHSAPETDAVVERLDDIIGLLKTGLPTASE